MAKIKDTNKLDNESKRKNKKTSIGKSSNSRRIDKHGKRQKKGHF